MKKSLVRDGCVISAIIILSMVIALFGTIYNSDYELIDDTDEVDVNERICDSVGDIDVEISIIVHHDEDNDEVIDCVD